MPLIYFSACHAGATTKNETTINEISGSTLMDNWFIVSIVSLVSREHLEKVGQMVPLVLGYELLKIKLIIRLIKVLNVNGWNPGVIIGR